MNNFAFMIVFIATSAVAFPPQNVPCPPPAAPTLPAPYIVSESHPSAKVSSDYAPGNPLSAWPQFSFAAYNDALLAQNALQVPAASLPLPVPAPLPAPLPAPAPCPQPIVSAAPLPNNIKGETIIHNPKPIIIRRPPTNVVINHPPIIVKPAPVAFHKPPAKVVRPVIVKNLPPSFEVQPIFKKILGPVQRKVIVSQPPCDGNVYAN